MALARRTLYLLKEIREKGSSFGLPAPSEETSSNDNLEQSLYGKWWDAEIQFPLTSQLGAENGARFELIVVHLRIHAGPWAGGHFRLQIDFRDKDYPFEPPSCKFLTKVWHPNINETGGICHSYLRLPNSVNPGTWTCVLRVHSLVSGLVAMFDTTDPAFNPFSPLNETAAEEFCRDKAQFFSHAADYARSFAVPVSWDRSESAIAPSPKPAPAAASSAATSSTSKTASRMVVVTPKIPEAAPAEAVPESKPRTSTKRRLRSAAKAEAAEAAAVVVRTSKRTTRRRKD